MEFVKDPIKNGLPGTSPGQTDLLNSRGVGYGSCGGFTNFKDLKVLKDFSTFDPLTFFICLYIAINNTIPEVNSFQLKCEANRLKDSCVTKLNADVQCSFLFK